MQEHNGDIAVPQRIDGIEENILEARNFRTAAHSPDMPETNLRNRYIGGTKTTVKSDQE